MSAPTHERRTQTLVFVLSFGLNLVANEICNTCISDHFAVLFPVMLPLIQVTLICSLTASQFSAVFSLSVPHTWVFFIKLLCPGEFLDDFNSADTDTQYLVAPFLCEHSKPVTEPWLIVKTPVLSF